MKGTAEWKKKMSILRELSEDWRENLAATRSLAQGKEEMMLSISRLSKKNNQGDMMKIGLTLIACPLPIVVDDVVGWSLLAAGLIQKKIKSSGLYLEDVQEATVKIVKELHNSRLDLGQT
ncbi:MAG: hypothetical protein V3T10_02955 [Candidatus Bathyarchaeia archaeon]